MTEYDKIQKIGNMRIYWKNGKVVAFQLPKCPDCGQEYSHLQDHKAYFCKKERKERE